MNERRVPERLRALTYEDRVAALEKAREARSMRARILERVRAGSMTLADVFADPGSERIRVSTLLRAVPGNGQRRVDYAFQTVGIAPNRRVAGLGQRQRDALVEMFDVVG